MGKNSRCELKTRYEKLINNCGEKVRGCDSLSRRRRRLFSLEIIIGIPCRVHKQKTIEFS